MTGLKRGRQLSLLDDDGLKCIHASGLVLNVRRSRRARRLSLRIVPPGAIEVVVPIGIRATVVERFVRDNGVWIDAARRELGCVYAAEQPALLPSVVDLPAIGCSYRVDYRRERGSRPRVLAAGVDALVVVAGGRDENAAAALRRWLLARGREHLKPWLAEVARTLDATPAAVQVRIQRTRWGSCSSQGRISLNAALLLVAPPLVRYLLVHELCHLSHMNHSVRFWTRVRRFEPDCKRLDRQLGEAWRDMPAWLFARPTE